MKNNNEIGKNMFIYKDLSLKKLQYNSLANNIERLKNDFKIFIGKNKTLKRFKVKVSDLDLQMKRIMKKIETIKIDHSQVLRSLNSKIEGKNKRFMSAKEIEKFREKKSYLLKILSIQTEKDKEISFNRRINEIKNRRMSLQQLKLNKFSATTSFLNKKKINFFDSRNSFNNKSIEYTPYINHSISNDRYNNKNKIRLIKQSSKTQDELIFQKNNSLAMPGTAQNKNILILNLGNNDNNSYNKKGESDINLDHIFDNNNISEDVYNLKRKVLLKKLKVKVDKFENSSNYLPDYDIIRKNKSDPYIFVKKKKNFGQFESNIFGKEEQNNNSNKRIIMKRIFSTPKNKLNKTLNQFSRNKYILPSKSKSKEKSEKNNTKIIIKKLNILKKGANNRKINMKTLYNRNNYSQKVFDFFTFDEGKKINQFFAKDIKNDSLKYKDELGNFAYIDGQFLFTKHLSHFKIGRVKAGNL